eukprot:TRINITY_DN14591_c0_g1_i3.p1 TRINITY_DN14591_c0_g1~~TRINITY_DN14591_c0_g1_i3.p1  ORF type:complete len:260 (-),score=53.26 TRINITY_DN14591_c0_g1_i3:21-707(-)
MALVLFFLIVTAVSGAPSSVSGPWYYLADGLQDDHPYSSIPSWMDNAGNVISLAFMNPSDIGSVSDPVPAAFKNATSYFLSKGKTVFFSIGGYGYSGNWNWINNPSAAANAGTICGNLAKQYKVGIEIDYEGGAADITSGMSSFISAFRKVCPMGDANCLLTTDLYGSPGGAGWQLSYIKAFLPPSGKPGQVYGNGNYIDWVNVMVIDEIGRAVQQECRDRSRMPSSA